MKKYMYGLVLGLLVWTACNSKTEKLPFLGPRSATEVTDAQGNKKIDSIYTTIPNFGFINQDSVWVTQDNFKNKIYIADFFFTSCTTICPIMHRNMKKIYDQYQGDNQLMFLSHSIDFKYDTPKKLKSYAEKLGVDAKRWEFVRGEKDSIYHMATKHYLVAVGEDNQAKDGYIHEGYLILIDKDKRIRGAYDGTNEEQVAKLSKDIAILEKEYQADAK